MQWRGAADPGFLFLFAFFFLHFYPGVNAKTQRRKGARAQKTKKGQKDEGNKVRMSFFTFLLTAAGVVCSAINKTEIDIALGVHADQIFTSVGKIADGIPSSGDGQGELLIFQA